MFYTNRRSPVKTPLSIRAVGRDGRGTQRDPGLRLYVPLPVSRTFAAGRAASVLATTRRAANDFRAVGLNFTRTTCVWPGRRQKNPPPETILKPRPASEIFHETSLTRAAGPAGRSSRRPG